MQEVVVGRTGLRASRLGMGTAPLASVFWGNDETTAVAAARRALDGGLTFFDTAPFYGLGESEVRLGAALDDRREGVVVATKVGRLLEVGPDGELEARFDFGYDAVRRSLESSLDRLSVDRVDIVHIHDPDDHVDEALAGAHRALVDLREELVIGAVSVGTNSVATAATFVERGDLDCVLVAGRYTLLDQSAASVIQQCAERGVAYVAAGVLNSGVLARPSEGAWYDYAPVAGPILDRARQIERICRRHDVSLRTAALQFVLAHPDVTVVIVGMAEPDEVDDNLRAVTAEVPDELWTELRESGLLETATSEEWSE
jgi:aryl-alcohol dehydrogenase-like predicted oxidoreductase